MRLYCFLGNHGDEYRNNRHNVAWQFLRATTFYSDLRWKKFLNSQCANMHIDGQIVYFILPETYMNKVGQSIVAIMRYHKIAPEDIVIIHDDLELALGVIGYKLGGGLGGHNGLRSVEACLGTRDFARFRIGIGRPNHSRIAEYVLSDFDEEEVTMLRTVFPVAEEALHCCLTGGIEEALIHWPKTSISKK